jgi:hypothetical protein
MFDTFAVELLRAPFNGFSQPPYRPARSAWMTVENVAAPARSRPPNWPVARRIDELEQELRRVVATPPIRRMTQRIA